MRFIGLLLLAATGAFTGLVIADNLSGGPDYTVSLLDRDIATLNTLAIFCSGLALALIFCLGLAMAMRGAAHRRRRDPRTRRTRVSGPDTMAGPNLQH
ncbi:hypothetical protein GCM10023084_23980 [Streptomyces lacrimifluminis]|uniref:Uncharacterized protein n=1 Tax=Streptomyces lacrimifluminis TaxID=1500077 RepID=A0A917KI86_9ACTN|nr:hypothetical protein [Streptomyces lacrimifluminis]GGJ15229.1 hypothetical protein GCM10012282_09280 [Streptomyces lacrimifluminis]